MRRTFGLLVLAACQDVPPMTPAQAQRPPDPAGAAKVTGFDVSPENLVVDKISMKDGLVSPDGNRDLVFVANVEGPLDALYLVTTTAKGEPTQGFRADTINGREELPSALGSVVDIGRLTVWIAIVEDGKYANDDGGGIHLGKGPHALKLIVPNTGNLRPGAHLRLYARNVNGDLAGGPVVQY